MEGSSTAGEIQSKQAQVHKLAASSNSPPQRESNNSQSKMTSRRGAVKINPVTGKLEKVEAQTGPDGVTKHRDGCMVVDDRYVNAAKELGLGGEGGMCMQGSGV